MNGVLQTVDIPRHTSHNAEWRISIRNLTTKAYPRKSNQRPIRGLFVPPSLPQPLH